MGSEIHVIGIGGHAVGIDPVTGGELWRTKLKSGNYVTVRQSGSQVLAGAGGVLFCLDVSTGQILWKNNLSGLGTGLITFMAGDAAAAAADHARKQRAAAIAATSAGS